MTIHTRFVTTNPVQFNLDFFTWTDFGQEASSVASWNASTAVFQGSSLNLGTSFRIVLNSHPSQAFDFTDLNNVIGVVGSFEVQIFNANTQTFETWETVTGFNGGNGLGVNIFYDALINDNAQSWSELQNGGTFGNPFGIYGSADNFVSTANLDRLVGFDGDDAFVWAGGADTVFGGGGSDTFSLNPSLFYSNTTGFTIDLATFETVQHLIAGSPIALGIFLDSVENIEGSSHSDDLRGNDAGNRLMGSLGNDTLVGRGGADDLQGGENDDVLRGGAGGDQHTGGNGTDLVSYVDSVQGVTVSLLGSNSNYVFNGDAIGDTFLDVIENIEGTFLQDILGGNAVNNEIYGSYGNDVLIGEAGADTLDGGEGFDFASYQTQAVGMTIDLENNIFNGDAISGVDGYDRFVSIEGYIGTRGDDTITGDENDNTLVGWIGRDTIRGGAGNDTLIDDKVAIAGSAGLAPGDLSNYNDILIGGAGADIFLGSGPFGADTDFARYESAVTVSLSGVGGTGDAAGDTFSSIEGLWGSNAADILSGTSSGLTGYLFGDGGADTLRRGEILDGGAGVDLADYSSASHGVHVALDANIVRLDDRTNTNRVYGRAFDDGDIGQDYLIDVENVTGSNSSDTITGNSVGNILQGGLGGDVLFGRAGVDQLFGGEDRDVLGGGAGGDVLNGGNGTDLASYEDATRGVTVSLLTPASNTFDGAGDSYVSIEGLIGSNQADILTGDNSSNEIYGGFGDDQLSGEGGNDFLIGGLSGHDSLVGGAGNDNLYVWSGDDTFVGGADSDTLNCSGLQAGVTLNLDLLFAFQVIAGGGVRLNDQIENIVGGNGWDTLTGNSLANLMYGGRGNDTLTGGNGADNLWGGLGEDSHIGGNDASIDYARYDDANYGNLTIRLDASSFNAGAAAVGDTYTGIEGLVGGLGADIVVGNGSANFLFGGGNNDYIDGRAGNDYMNGGAGADRFVFATALGVGNIDTIADFTTATDDIVLNAAIFAAVGATLTADEFRVGAAVDANDFILYNSATGALTYDSNGVTAGGAVQFATLATGLALTFDDFIVA